MTSIDTRVYGDASACAAAAAALAQARTDVAAAADHFAGAAGRVGDAWRGDAALAFVMTSRDTAENLDKAETQIAQVQSAVSGFATTLRSVQDAMTQLRATANAQGLRLTADAVLAPDQPAEGADDATILAYNESVRGYNALVEQANHERWREDGAHSTLGDGLEKAKGIGPLTWFLDKAGLVPEDVSDVAKNWMFGAALVGNAAAWTAIGRGVGHLSRFAPRWPAGTAGGLGGQFRRIADMSKWDRFLTVLKDTKGTQWVARPGKSAARARWGTVGKWAGRAGVLLSFAQGAYDQFDKDSDDRSLSTGTKVARAGTVGLTTAGGAWAGGLAGAQLGAAIGAFGGPVGAAAGGIIGGVVGGIAGSEGGKRVGEFLIDHTPKAVDAAKGWLSRHNPFSR